MSLVFHPGRDLLACLAEKQNQQGVCVCVCVCKEVYYKKLIHRIMETGKSQDLQSELASKSPGEPMVYFQCESTGLRTRGAGDAAPV